MEAQEQEHNDEIDLVELLQTLWDGKMKIAAFVAISAISIVGLFYVQPAPKFIAITEIKPLGSNDAELYRLSNSLGFFEIYITPEAQFKEQNLIAIGVDENEEKEKEKKTPITSVLETLFIEELDRGLLFAEAFREYGTLERGDFKSDAEFDTAISAAVSQILITSKINVDSKENDPSRRNWTIQFEFNDKDKWKSILTDVTGKANAAVREALKKKFASALAAAKQKQVFDIEDLKTSIKNAIDDHEQLTVDRLAFLIEQASIARKLDIPKNTIEAQNLGGNLHQFLSASTKPTTTETVRDDEGKIVEITEINTNGSTKDEYLRGYEVIEKEIEILKTRIDKKNFVTNLRGHEQKLRALQQDKGLERAEGLFATTPVMSDDDFSAVTMAVAATDFKPQNKRGLLLASGIVIGGMIGVVYVLAANAMAKRRKQIAS